MDLDGEGCPQVTGPTSGMGHIDPELADEMPTGTRLPATWNYGAVERALRESRTRGERCIFLPQESQVFQSVEEAFEFFNMYSWEAGFGIRYGRSRVNCSGVRTRQDVVCSCEGKDRAESSRSARCGCPCTLSLLRADDDSWFVKKNCPTHNRAMSVSCGEKRRWPSHSRIDGSMRELVRHLRANNVQLSRTILTDQCHQMKVAIEAELPRTRHRWCKWHVLRKAKESLGPVYSKNSAFKRDLHELLDQLVGVEEFEKSWAELVSRYSLGENEFLVRAYENRAMWAKPYFVDTFCAGMTSTQRSESANHVLKTYIPRSALMHLFVTQYDRLVTDRIAEEGREQHATKQVNFLLRAGVPIERHATRVYTRALFERFFRELFRSGAFKCVEEEPGARYVVSYVRTAPQSDAATLSYVVELNDDRSIISCVCKSFEHSGIPCRHVLKVLVHSGAVELPACLVKKRWTTTAREGAKIQIAGFVEAASRGAEAASMHGLLHSSAMELVGMGTTSRQAFEVAVEYLSQAKAVIKAMLVDDPASEAFGVQTAHEGGEVLEFDPAIAAPPRVRSRGRPKELRFKSPIESPGARKRLATAGPGGVSAVEPRPRRSTRFLKTGVYVVEHCRTCETTAHRTSECTRDLVHEEGEAKRRSCKSCGEVGHNRTTCGRKSSYVAK
ncbi:unnamed protein product [Alopecurus aequalis]